MNNNIACYIRVSTDKEDQQKSLDRQRILLQEQFKDSNISLYSDTGTGTSFNRVGFKQLLFDCGLNARKLRDGRITFEADLTRDSIYNEIIVLSSSRFARNIAIIDILRVLWDYKKVNVKFLDVQKDSSNSSDMILLQMFFAMAENEVKETSVRTKRGNKTSIIQNRIRNNSIFGWDFDRETNSLIANLKEKVIVEFIFKTSLTNGLKKTAKIVNEKGYRTKKGNLWTDSTIKTLITNPKYKGYNVRNKFNNINLFTESKTKYVKKEHWIIQKNERIEPLVSEELWEEVQKALEERCISGNRGQNARIYDTRGKIKCNCGANYTRCVTTRVADKPREQHYLICGNKKKYSKNYCSSENITVGTLDNFIEEQRVNYYKNIQLQIQIKIIQLENELEKINSNEIFNTKDKENKLEILKNKLEKLIDTFIASSETMQEVLQNKINELEKEISKLEFEIANSKSINFNREKHQRDINSKITKLRDNLKTLSNKELTRKEWLDKVESITINSKLDFKVKYNFE
ncbi:recombinase family protein [Clostridium perfringens]|uniref:recombinase family protein n=1 Tax=Clostridium perfringens TaxID=1502 RepID=UPI000E51DEF7|nr:recombinase family protein [Clostridium perfringens]MDK0592573.1 recombinase family protein [Clostridium perfringens]MDK0595599.1 recombinase family protein [Clostridium perfringens]MDK0689812.1 recombinase family protein [Clostridium perfringens]MDM0786590.1 recombinase family protein [Clostridium perfringens]RHN27928.1 recombinase family protein [Clostridium perfringens]